MSRRLPPHALYENHRKSVSALGKRINHGVSFQNLKAIHIPVMTVGNERGASGECFTPHVHTQVIGVHRRVPVKILSSVRRSCLLRWPSYLNMAAPAIRQEPQVGILPRCGGRPWLWTRSLLLQLGILSIILFVQLVQRLLEMTSNQLCEICVIDRGSLLAYLT